jgi:hypothetical protein
MADVPDSVLDRLIQQESGGNPNAHGKAGEIGLAQIKPSTAAQYGVTPEALWHPEVNREVAKRYLGSLVDHYHGNLQLAVAAYNAGPGNVDRGHIPASTHNYVRNILGTPLTQVAAAPPAAPTTGTPESWERYALSGLGTGISAALGEGTAQAADIPMEMPRVTPRPSLTKEEFSHPEGVGEEKTALFAPNVAPYEETPRPQYAGSPPLPTGPVATFANPMGANIFKLPPKPPMTMRTRLTQTIQNLRQSGQQVAQQLPDQFINGMALTEPSRFGRWVDMMTDAIAQLPPARYGAPKGPTINLPLIRQRSEEQWSVPYGDPRSPMWKPSKGASPMESALKASVEEAAPFLVLAGAPLIIPVVAEGLGVAGAVGSTPLVTEFMWNGVGIPAVTSALSPLLDKATDHLADGIARTGMIKPQEAYPMANSLMNVFRFFPQLAFFPRDAAALARAMTSRDIVPELADLGEWVTGEARGPWVAAVERFLNRQGFGSRFIPFDLREALQHEHEDEVRAVLERARSQEAVSARRQAELERQLRLEAEQQEVPSTPAPVLGTPYGGEEQ